MTKMIECVLNGRYKIVLPQHRAERPEWYNASGWEKARLDAMHDRINNKSVVYYVGSEEGDMPALCQLWGAKMVLFEPNPKVWSNTKAIWKANKLESPMTFQGFCSTETRIIDSKNWLQKGFPVCADDEIIAAHGFKELDKEADSYNQIRIDDVVKQYLPPTMITIDVEGAEGHVLRGAINTLKDHKPTIVLSLHPEFLITQYKEWGAELRGWIKDLGYRETLLDYQHEVHLLYEAL